MSSHKAQNILISPVLSVQTLSDILRREGFAETEAAHLAKTFTDSSIDGVYTHGLNRFPRFVDLIRRGHVVPSAKPERTLAVGWASGRGDTQCPHCYGPGHGTGRIPRIGLCGTGEYQPLDARWYLWLASR